MSKQPFDEIIHGLFYDIVRSAGVSLNGNQLAKIRIQTAKLATVIEVQAELKAIEVAKRLQLAVTKGFKDMAKDIAKLENKINTLNNNIEPQAKLDPFEEN